MNSQLKVFDTASVFDIGYIMAETPKSDGSRARPYDTVLPLANSLGLTVDISWYVTSSSNLLSFSSCRLFIVTVTTPIVSLMLSLRLPRRLRRAS